MLVYCNLSDGSEGIAQTHHERLALDVEAVIRSHEPMLVAQVEVVTVVKPHSDSGTQAYVKPPVVADVAQRYVIIALAIKLYPLLFACIVY